MNEPSLEVAENINLVLNTSRNDSVYVWNSDYIDKHIPVYDVAASFILTGLYVPVFLVSIFGNIVALIVLIKTATSSTRTKNAFIINLVIADLASKYVITCSFYPV